MSNQQDAADLCNAKPWSGVMIDDKGWRTSDGGTTTEQALELRRQLEADMLKLIGDFESITKMHIRCINLHHVDTNTLAGNSPRRLIADLDIEVSL